MSLTHIPTHVPTHVSAHISAHIPAPCSQQHVRASDLAPPSPAAPTMPSPRQAKPPFDPSHSETPFDPSHPSTTEPCCCPLSLQPRPPQTSPRQPPYPNERARAKAARCRTRARSARLAAPSLCRWPPRRQCCGRAHGSRGDRTSARGGGPTEPTTAPRLPPSRAPRISAPV